MDEVSNEDHLRMFYESKLASDVEVWNLRAEVERRFRFDAMFVAKVTRAVNAAVLVFDPPSQPDVRAMREAAAMALMLAERDAAEENDQ
jgi:hypothetical protein